MTAPGTCSALAGLRVLDLSRLLPGPYLTRVLADLGADVIRVEAPDGGDWVRQLPPLVGEYGAAHAALHYGKRSIALDLKKPAGVSLLLAMVREADVLVESFRPGVLARLGLGWDTLQQANPRIVLCSISGFGQEGPLARAPGHDLGYIGRAGVLGMFGPADAPPQVPGVQIADLAGGALTAAVGVLAALRERDRTGQGRWLDISMARGAASLLAMELPRRLAGHAEPRGRGLLTGGVPCYRAYRTRDGRYVALAALEPKFFADFCTRAGCPELVPHAYDQDEDGVATIEALAKIFATRTQAEWVELLAGGESCCEAVVEPEEALLDAAIGLRTVEAGGARALATDVGFGPVVATNRDVPAIGADATSVLADLHIDPELTAAARATGALVDGPKGSRATSPIGLPAEPPRR